MSQPFRIGEFTSELANRGFVNTSYYTVEITPPSIMANSLPQNLARSLPLRIETASLPSRQVLTHNLRLIGPERKIPYAYTTAAPFTCRIILSETMIEREFFLRWQDIFLGQTRRGVTTAGDSFGIFDSGYYDDATDTSAIIIKTFATSPKWQTTTTNQLMDVARSFNVDTKDISKLTKSKEKERSITESCSIKLLKVYPIVVADVPLGWGEGATYGTLDVTFEYYYAEEEHKSYDQSITSEFSKLPGAGKLSKLPDRFKPIVSGIKSAGLITSAKNNAKVAIKSANPFK